MIKRLNIFCFIFYILPSLSAIHPNVAHSICEINVTCFDDPTIKWCGSGCIIRENGKHYLYSNAHVLLGGKIEVNNLAGLRIKLGKPQLLKDDSRDMIRFEVQSQHGLLLGEIPPANSRVFSYGNGGCEGTVAKVGSFLQIGENFDIYHTIPNIGGDSGGPIFNDKGKVFGLVWGRKQGNMRGASFQNLQWFAHSEEQFQEFSKIVSKHMVKADFWYNKTFNYITLDYIYEKRNEWKPVMQEMLNITDRERVSAAYKINDVKDTLGLITTKEHFLSSLDLLYSFLPAPKEIQQTTAALIKYHTEIELDNLETLSKSLPERSWLRENLLDLHKKDYLKIKTFIEERIPPSNHDLGIFVDSAKSKKWIKVNGELVPIVSLPFLGRFWDAFYNNFYTGKNFGIAKTINPNLYLGPAYLQHVCSKQWVQGKYQFGIMNKGMQSTVLTRTALMHMSDKVEQIKFNPNNWRPEWDKKLKDGIKEGNINGLAIPQFLNSVSPVIRQNMVIKAEEFMLELYNETEIQAWLSFLNPKNFDILSAKSLNKPNWLHAKHSRMVEGIEHIDPQNRIQYRHED